MCQELVEGDASLVGRNAGEIEGDRVGDAELRVLFQLEDARAGELLGDRTDIGDRAGSPAHAVLPVGQAEAFGEEGHIAFRHENDTGEAELFKAPEIGPGIGDGGSVRIRSFFRGVSQAGRSQGWGVGVWKGRGG